MTITETRHGTTYTFTRPGKPDIHMFVTRGVPFDMNQAKANAEYWWAK